MCYSLYSCARVKAVYAYLQLGQDARAKQVLDLALRIENELLASKHDSGLRARPFGIAAMEARWTLERHDWAAAAALPCAGPAMRMRLCRISRALSASPAAASRNRQRSRSRRSPVCRKRWRTQRIFIGQGKPASSA